MTLAALTKPASSFTQTGCGCDAGIFQDWNHADNNADENSQPRRKKKDRVIYADLVQARQSRGRGGNYQLKSAVSEAQTVVASCAAQHQAVQMQSRNHILAV